MHRDENIIYPLYVCRAQNITYFEKNIFKTINKIIKKVLNIIIILKILLILQIFIFIKQYK